MDGLYHLMQEHREQFERADVVLIEKQPMQGLLDIEAVLYMRYIDKVSMIMPRRMHSFLGICKLSYEERKEKTEAYAEEMLERLGEDCAKHKYKVLHRRHDVADAICFIACFTDLCKKRFPKRRPNPFLKYALPGKKVF